MSKKLFMLYDERARINTDDASVLAIAFSLDEAQADKRHVFPNAVIFEYDAANGELTNERLVDD